VKNTEFEHGSPGEIIANHLNNHAQPWDGRTIRDTERIRLFKIDFINAIPNMRIGVRNGSQIWQNGAEAR